MNAHFDPTPFGPLDFGPCKLQSFFLTYTAFLLTCLLALHTMYKYYYYYIDFNRYAQALPYKSQTAIATAILLWTNFLHYGFPTKIVSDQGHNFESEPIANQC